MVSIPVMHRWAEDPCKLKVNRKKVVARTENVGRILKTKVGKGEVQGPDSRTIYGRS